MCRESGEITAHPIYVIFPQIMLRSHLDRLSDFVGPFHDVSRKRIIHFVNAHVSIRHSEIGVGVAKH